MYKHGGLIPLLKKYYPEYHWDESGTINVSFTHPLTAKTQLVGAKTQTWILNILLPIFHEKSDGSTRDSTI